ncbi:DNA/RNA non-specific endonuclease [Glycomyces albidus]|uniref:Type VII secretion system protein EssD-like domain-containing protein n=1 Tax=Glycomyces albidus TaxID=2656774 RepID=A0A6L5G7C8_9ACTN|nr:DNA/RNA non-specific endonuclease [Glycomyces albidus]MQM25511.1 hypothetical protein [Glycomyces albidus]
MYAPSPPVRPPRPRWYENPNIIIPVGMTAALAALFAAVTVVIAINDSRTGTLGNDPAASFAEADAVDFGYTYTAPDGTRSGGQFTVTADGYAAGSVTDSTAGSATVHTTPDGSAVWGDENWWARRQPALASHVKDQWVQAEHGTALPIDPAAEFTPAALADLVRTIDDHGTAEPDVTVHQGTAVTAKTWQDWTLVRTRTLPADVVSLSGPIDPGMFHTAAAPHATVEAVPAVWDGDPDTFHPQTGGSAGVLVLETPAPAPPGAAATTKDTTRTTLGGDTDAATTTPPRGEADIELPPDLASFVTPLPAFTGTINASTCSTPTCTWSATVQNIGDGPGEATATVSATPGMGSQTIPLGTVQPGSSASTGSLSFANPAPTPQPGQTTSVMVTYSLVIYSPQIAGQNAPRYRELVDRLGGYTIQPLLDQIMQQLDTGLKDAAVEAMHSMLDAEVAPEEVLSALDQAGQADPARGEYSEAPLLRQLAAAGDRFASWAPIADQLTTVSPIELPYYLPGLEAAAQELAHPASPTVALTYTPGSDGAPAEAVVVSEYPDQVRCTGIITAGSGGLGAAVDRGAAITEDAVDDCPATVRITIPETEPLTTATPRELLERLHVDAPDLAVCRGGGGFEGATVVNQTGEWSWTAPEICTASLDEVNREALESLNELPQSVRDELKNASIVTLDAAGAVTAINWDDPDRPCKSEIVNPDAEDVPFGSGNDRKGGPRAVGGYAYLCAPLNAGQGPQVDPWDYPATERRTPGNGWVFARCHLVADILGGQGNGDNLVTCYHGGTNLRMEWFERKARDSVTAESHMLYIARPVYYGHSDDPNYPPLGAIQLIAISKWVVMEYVYINSPEGLYWSDRFVEADVP